MRESRGIPKHLKRYIESIGNEIFQLLQNRTLLILVPGCTFHLFSSIKIYSTELQTGLEELWLQKKKEKKQAEHSEMTKTGDTVEDIEIKV